MKHKEEMEAGWGLFIDRRVWLLPKLGLWNLRDSRRGNRNTGLEILMLRNMVEDGFGVGESDSNLEWGSKCECGSGSGTEREVKGWRC